MQRRVEDLDSHRGATAAGLQRCEQLGYRLLAIPWKQASSEGFADEIGVRALRRVAREPNEVPRPQRAPPVSRPAKKRLTGVPSFAGTPRRGVEGRVVQLHSGDTADYLRGQLGHLATAAEEMPAVEHDADVPKPACFDHGYRGAQIRNGAPGQELEVDRQPPRGCTFTKRTKSIGQEGQVFCRRKRRRDIH